MGSLVSGRRTLLTELRDSNPLTLADWASWFTFQGTAYPFFPSQSIAGQKEEVGGTYMGLVEGAYKSDGVVFALMLTRQLLFSEACFTFRTYSDEGRPGDYVTGPGLRPLEQPWPNGQTSDLLARAIQDVDLAGNFYGRRVPGGIQRLRPDWVTIVLGDTGVGKVIAGYLYEEGGRAAGKDPVPLDASEVAHWAPTPDPSAWFRGMSWLLPIIREIEGDLAATSHYGAFYQNGATPNFAVQMDPSIDQETTKQWIELFRESTEGVANAYKTMYLGGGANVVPLGATLRQLDFTSTQAHQETRMCAAARVPPVLAGLSEGLDSATYSNYQQARRVFADGTMRPLWRSLCSALATIITEPPQAKLWYDDRDVPWLAEDQTNVAETQEKKATAMQLLVNAGYDPESVVEAIENNDLSYLEHSGMVSVQLHDPSATPPTPSPPAQMPPQGGAQPGQKQPPEPAPEAVNGSREELWRRAGFSEAEIARMKAALLSEALWSDADQPG